MMLHYVMHCAVLHINKKARKIRFSRKERGLYALNVGK